MTKIKISGFKIYRDRHGQMRCYHRKSRTAINLQVTPLGSAGFFAQCVEITERIEENQNNAKKGTLGFLMAAYKESTWYSELSPRTRSDYQIHMGYFGKIADMPIKLITTPFVANMRDKMVREKSWDFATRKMGFISVLMRLAVERGWASENPVTGMKKPKKPSSKKPVNRPWTDYEREKVLEYAPPHIKLPIALMMFTGIDPVDALKYPKNGIDNGRIELKRSKTEGRVKWPIPPQLMEIINGAPQHHCTTLCATSRGQPWTGAGFRASWRKFKIELAKRDDVELGDSLTLKGLRHTVATILAEMDYDPRTIADVLGQKTTAMAEEYSKEAKLDKKMKKVSKKHGKEMNKRRS